MHTALVSEHTYFSLCGADESQRQQSSAFGCCVPRDGAAGSLLLIFNAPSYYGGGPPRCVYDV